MRNLAIKYAILTHQQDIQKGIQIPFKRLVEEFSFDDPLAVFLHFKKRLSAEQYGILRFGFPDKALSDIIMYEHELVLSQEVPDLGFVKASLDLESFRLAGDVRREFSTREQDLIDSLSAWLLEASQDLYQDYISPSRADHIRQTYCEMLRLYAEKYTQFDPKALFKLSSLGAMTAFTHAMTADAMFKADAAKLLFGEKSAYYQAWLNQQMFRNLLSQAVKGYILSFAA